MRAVGRCGNHRGFLLDQFITVFSLKMNSLSASMLHKSNYSLLVALEAQSCFGTAVEGEWSFEMLLVGKKKCMYLLNKM